MSKRNFILLIAVLTVIVGAALLYLYINRPGGPNAPTDGGTNFIDDFNPFGTSKNVPPSTNEPGNNTENPGTENPSDPSTPLKLVKVSSMPVAGYAVYLKERYKYVPEVVPVTQEATIQTETTATASPKPVATTPTAPPTEFVPALRYVARSNGNIYQTFADSIEERKFSSTIVPKVYEAMFGNKAESVTMRYLKGDDRTIVTFVGALPKEVLGGDTTDTNEVQGYFLPDNVTSVSISPDTQKTFYLFNSGGSSVGITTNPQGSTKSQIFDSAFTEWLTEWPNINTITLNTKPSSGVAGYMYGLDPVKKTFSKVLGDINGLTTLMSPNGKLVLYGDNSLTLGIYNTETRETNPLSVRGMPEKCVWAKTNDFVYCGIPKNNVTGSFPDDWYKGEATFSDSIWKIDVINGNTEVVLDPLTVPGGEDTDAIKLALDDTGTYLFFVNKKDSFLWKINLVQ